MKPLFSNRDSLLDGQSESLRRGAPIETTGFYGVDTTIKVVEAALYEISPGKDAADQSASTLEPYRALSGVLTPRTDTGRVKGPGDGYPRSLGQPAQPSPELSF